MGPTPTTGPSDAVERLAGLAASQCGVVSCDQARGAGLDRDGLRRLVRRGILHKAGTTVYSFPGHADSTRRRIWLAHLDAGRQSVVSHRSAAQLHGLHPVQAAHVDLIVPRSARPTGPRPGGLHVVRHRPASLGPDEVTLVHGLPVTDPARTIIDLAAVVSLIRLRRVVENAEVERLCPVAAIGTRLSHARRKGLTGVAALERVLDELGPGEGLAHSELERLLDAALDGGDLPPPERQYPLPGGGPSERVDRAWPTAKLIVEADGRRWHTRRADFERDRRRDLDAAAQGWLTVRATWEMLLSDPAGFARRITHLYRQRASDHRRDHSG